jgi:hypothetical protein
MPDLFPENVWQRIAAHMEGSSGTLHIAEVALPPTRPQSSSLRLTSQSVGVSICAPRTVACLDVM